MGKMFRHTHGTDSVFADKANQRKVLVIIVKGFFGVLEIHCSRLQFCEDCWYRYEGGLMDFFRWDG